MASSKKAPPSRAPKGIDPTAFITIAMEHRSLALGLNKSVTSFNDAISRSIAHIEQLKTFGKSEQLTFLDDIFIRLTCVHMAIHQTLERLDYDHEVADIGICMAVASLLSEDGRCIGDVDELKYKLAYNFDLFNLCAPKNSDAAKYLNSEYQGVMYPMTKSPYTADGKVNVPTCRGEAQARGYANYISRMLRDNYLTELEEAFLFIAYSMFDEVKALIKDDKWNSTELDGKFKAVIGYFMTPQGEVTRYTFSEDSIPELTERMEQEFSVKLSKYISPAIVRLVSTNDTDLSKTTLEQLLVNDFCNCIGELYRADLCDQAFDFDDYDYPPIDSLYSDVQDEDECDEYDPWDDGDDSEDEDDWEDEDEDIFDSAYSMGLPKVVQNLFTELVTSGNYCTAPEAIMDLHPILVKVQRMMEEDPSLANLSVAQLKKKLGLDSNNVKPSTSVKAIKLIDVPKFGKQYQELCKKLSIHFKKYNVERDYKIQSTLQSHKIDFVQVIKTYEHIVGTQTLKVVSFIIGGDNVIELEPILGSEFTDAKLEKFSNFIQANFKAILATGSGKLEDQLPSLSTDIHTPKKSAAFSTCAANEESYSPEQATANVNDKEAFAKDQALSQSTKLIAFPRNITNARSRVTAFKRRFARGATTSDNPLESFILTELGKLKTEVASAKNAPKQKDASIYEKKVLMALASWLSDEGILQADLANDKMRQAIADYIEDAQWCILPVNSIALSYAEKLALRSLTDRSVPAYKDNGQFNECTDPDEGQIRIEALKRHVYKTTDRISDEQLAIMRLLNIMANIKDIVRPNSSALTSQIDNGTALLYDLVTPRGEINKDSFTQEKYQRVYDQCYELACSLAPFDISLTNDIKNEFKWDPSPYSYDFEENRVTAEDTDALNRISALQKYYNYHSTSSREKKVITVFHKLTLLADEIKRFSRKIFFDCCMESAHAVAIYINDDGSVINTFSNKHMHQLENVVARYLSILKDLSSDPDKARYKYY